MLGAVIPAWHIHIHADRWHWPSASMAVSVLALIFTVVNGKRNLTHFRQAKTDPPLAFIRLVDVRWGPVRDPGL
jgi:hypothetical protein